MMVLTTLSTRCPRPYCGGEMAQESDTPLGHRARWACLLCSREFYRQGKAFVHIDPDEVLAAAKRDTARVPSSNPHATPAEIKRQLAGDGKAG